MRRPPGLIRHELQTAEAYRDRYRNRPSSNPLVLEMREENEADIDRLTAELSEAE